MSLPLSIPKTADELPLDSLLVLTRTAFGLGLGMLMADKIKRPLRQAAAITLLAHGATPSDAPKRSGGRARARGYSGLIQAPPRIKPASAPCPVYRHLPPANRYA